MMTDTVDNAVSLRRDVSRLWTHIVDLGALQCRLFAVEFRRSSAKLQKAILLTIIGGVLLMASIPLLLAAVALQLSTSTGLSLAASLVIVGAGALLLMVPTLAVAYRLGRHSVKALISPVRDLEINLRSLAGDPPSPTAVSSYSEDPYSNAPYSDGVQ